MARHLLRATAVALLVRVAAADDSCGKGCAPSPAPTPITTPAPTGCTEVSGVRVKVLEVHTTGSTCVDWSSAYQGEVDLFVRVSMGTVEEDTLTVDNSATAAINEEFGFGCQSESTALAFKVYNWDYAVNDLCFTVTSGDWL